MDQPPANADELLRRHLFQLIALHENNAIVVYSDTLALQIPRSYAANAFNVFQQACIASAAEIASVRRRSARLRLLKADTGHPRGRYRPPRDRSCGLISAAAVTNCSLFLMTAIAALAFVACAGL
jgi:hypothetical protein